MTELITVLNIEKLFKTRKGLWQKTNYFIWHMPSTNKWSSLLKFSSGTIIEEFYFYDLQWKCSIDVNKHLAKEVISTNNLICFQMNHNIHKRLKQQFLPDNYNELSRIISSRQRTYFMQHLPDISLNRISSAQSVYFQQPLTAIDPYQNSS